MENKKVVYFMYFLAIVAICLTMPAGTNNVKEEVKVQVSAEAIMPSGLNIDELNEDGSSVKDGRTKEKKKNPQQDSHRAALVETY